MKAHAATLSIALLARANLAPVNAHTTCVSEYKSNIFLRVTVRKARFPFDAINLRAGPGSRYCNIRELRSGLTKPLQVKYCKGNWRGGVFVEKPIGCIVDFLQSIDAID